eukprot:7360380-Ditylum_brightwellii.AAC.1
MAWTYYCNNLTAIRRLQNHKHGYKHHPVVTIKPDFDVQLQIEDILCPFKLYGSLYMSKVTNQEGIYIGKCSLITKQTLSQQKPEMQ